MEYRGIYQYQSLSGDMMNNDFLTVKVGDLNSSATGNSNSNNVESDLLDCDFDHNGTSFTEGEFVKMDVTSKISITSPELNGQ